MSNTPLVNTSGRASCAMRASASAGEAILRSKVGTGRFACAIRERRDGSGVLEQAYHPDDVPGARGETRRGIGFLPGDYAHQVHHATLGHDLHRIGVEQVGFDEARLDLGRDETVIRTIAD